MIVCENSDNLLLSWHHDWVRRCECQAVRGHTCHSLPASTMLQLQYTAAAEGIVGTDKLLSLLDKIFIRMLKIFISWLPANLVHRIGGWSALVTA